MYKRKKTKKISNYLLLLFLVSNVSEKNNIRCMETILSHITKEVVITTATIAGTVLVGYIARNNTSIDPSIVSTPLPIPKVVGTTTNVTGVAEHPSLSIPTEGIHATFLDKAEAYQPTYGFDVSSKVTSNGGVQIDVTNGGFHASVRTMPVSRRQREIALLNAILDSDVEFKQKYFSNVSKMNHAIGLMLDANKNARGTALTEIATLDFEGKRYGKKLNEINGHLLAACANENGELVHLDGRNHNLEGVARHCLQEQLKINTNLNDDFGTSFPTTEAEYAKMFNITIDPNIRPVSTSTLPHGIKDSAAFTSKIRATSKELADKYKEGIPKIPITQWYNGKVVASSEQRADSTWVLFTQYTNEKCKEFGIDPTTNVWEKIGYDERAKILSNPQLAKECAQLTTKETAIKESYINLFNLGKAPLPKIKPALDELVEKSLDLNDVDSRNKLLMDIALGKKYPEAQQYFVGENGILKCFAGNPYANTLKLNPEHSQQLRESIIINANKLCSTIFSEDKSKTKPLYAGLRALTYAGTQSEEDAKKFVEVAECLLKAQQGNPAYQHFLQKTENWPFDIRAHGPTESDLEFVREMVEEYQIEESLKDGEVWIVEDTIFFNEQENKYSVERRLIKDSEENNQNDDENKPPKKPDLHPNDPARQVELAKKLKEETEKIEAMSEAYYEMVRKDVEALNSKLESKGIKLRFDKDTMWHSAFGHIRRGKHTGSHYNKLENMPKELERDMIKYRTHNKVIIKRFCNRGGTMKLESINPTFRDKSCSTYFEDTAQQIIREMAEAVEEGSIELLPQNKYRITLKDGLSVEIPVCAKTNRGISYYPYIKSFEKLS